VKSGEVETMATFCDTPSLIRGRKEVTLEVSDLSYLESWLTTWRKK